MKIKTTKKSPPNGRDFVFMMKCNLYSDKSYYKAGSIAFAIVSTSVSVNLAERLKVFTNS